MGTPNTKIARSLIAERETSTTNSHISSKVVLHTQISQEQKVIIIGMRERARIMGSSTEIHMTMLVDYGSCTTIPSFTRQRKWLRGNYYRLPRSPNKRPKIEHYLVQCDKKKDLRIFEHRRAHPLTHNHFCYIKG